MFHGLIVFIPTLVLGSFLWGPLGSATGLALVAFYWIREDSDTLKALKIENAHERNDKLKDSKRDRFFPIFFFVFANLIVYF